MRSKTFKIPNNVGPKPNDKRIVYSFEEKLNKQKEDESSFSQALLSLPCGRLGYDIRTNVFGRNDRPQGISYKSKLVDGLFVQRVDGGYQCYWLNRPIPHETMVELTKIEEASRIINRNDAQDEIKNF